jgi:hypothetical protein
LGAFVSYEENEVLSIQPPENDEDLPENGTI